MKRALVAVLAAALSVQCTQLPIDPLQLLMVTVKTTGTAPDLAGYIATVDGTQAQPVDADGSVTFTGLTAGDHLVELSGFPANCYVDGNPQTVSLAADGVAEASFSVVCVATGGLIVQAITTDVATNSDGFTVMVDGNPQLAQAIGPTGSVVFDDLAAGQHWVALTGYASSCAVAGDNPRATTVVEDDFALIQFVVVCDTVGPHTPGTGSLMVVATTTGSSLDSDGYWVTVDGNDGQRKAVGPNGSVLFDGLTAGEHVVALSGVEANCLPEPTPQLVTVPDGGVADASFALTCTGTGWLLVRATTTGSDVDADGYIVTVDGNDALQKQIGPNGSAAFSGLTAGEHLVVLTGVASNCLPEPDPQLVTVPESGVAEAAFHLTCVGAGGLVVQATTTGSEVDADGYTVSVDGDEALTQAVGPNSSVAFTDLGPGEHVLMLTGVAANCSVAESNPQTVTVAADATVYATFAVTCAGTGSLVVQATTTGSDLDPDGYTATVDGDDTGSMTVGANGSVLFEDLPPGEHSVMLTGVADNCSVVEPDPRTITVAAATTVQATFAVTCVAEPPLPPGTLQVIASTTGVDIDPDGYTATVDGNDARSMTVDANGSVLFEGLAVGGHTVLLGGVADNCSVTDPNPRTITMLEGEGVEATFAVTCESDTPPPPPGTLQVVASTTGVDIDPDGYTATVDGNNTGRMTVDTNGSVLFEGLAAGEHTLLLGGVADNCSVADPNPRTITVLEGEGVQATFAVTCVAIPPPIGGSLRVEVTTTGCDPGTEAYTVKLDGAFAGTVPTNGAVTLEDLAAGEHTVRLSGVHGDCRVRGHNPVTVSIEKGATAEVAFEVVCKD